MRAAVALGVALAVVGCDERQAPAYTSRRIAEDQARAAGRGAEPNRVEREPQLQPAVANDPGGTLHNPWLWAFVGQTAYHVLKPTPRAREPEQHHHHYAPAPAPAYRPAPAPQRSPPVSSPARTLRPAPRPAPRAYRPAPSRAPRSPGYSSRPASGRGR